MVDKFLVSCYGLGESFAKRTLNQAQGEVSIDQTKEAPVKRTIVLSVIAVLGTAASAVAQDATDAPPPLQADEAAPAMPDPPLQSSPDASGDTGAEGKPKPVMKPARPKGKDGALPRKPKQDPERQFQAALALAQSLHTPERCGAAFLKYLELAKERPDDPDVLWGLSECGVIAAGFDQDPVRKRQRLLDAQGAYRRYAEIERRRKFTVGKKSRVARARDRASQLETQIAALPAPAPAVVASAADAREFPRHAETLPFCQGKSFWHPDYGFDQEFFWQLFEQLHVEPELRVTIHGLPQKWHDGARQLFRTANDLAIGKDRSYCQNHGFCVKTVLRDFKTYVDRVEFVTVHDETPGPARVTLHHTNGIAVTVVRCDAVRGALAWAVEEKQRQAIADVGIGIRPADRSLVIATAAPPPTPPLKEGEGEGVGAPPPAEPPPAAAPVLAPAPVADVAPPPAAVAVAPMPPAEASPPAAAAAPPPPPAAAAPVDPARAQAERALEALTTSLLANPNDLALQEQWMLIATLAGRCADVMPVYLRIAEASKNPKVHQAGAACAEELEQPRETFLALERYVRTLPRYEVVADTYRVIAEGFVDLGERGRARHYFEQYLARADRSDSHRADAERFVQGFKRARTDCFIQRGVATAALAQVGDRWVVQVRIPPNALEQEPTCGE